jgi:hypothetical protein
VEASLLRREALQNDAPPHLHDSALCALYAAVLTAVMARIGWTAFAAAVVWPFAVWNWLMGWAIFEHHTHPDAPWFDNPAGGAPLRADLPSRGPARLGRPILHAS